MSIDQEDHFYKLVYIINGCTNLVDERRIMKCANYITDHYNEFKYMDMRITEIINGDVEFMKLIESLK